MSFFVSLSRAFSVFQKNWKKIARDALLLSVFYFTSWFLVLLIALLLFGSTFGVSIFSLASSDISSIFNTLYSNPWLFGLDLAILAVLFYLFTLTYKAGVIYSISSTLKKEKKDAWTFITEKIPSVFAAGVLSFIFFTVLFLVCGVTFYFLLKYLSFIGAILDILAGLLLFFFWISFRHGLYFNLTRAGGIESFSLTISQLSASFRKTIAFGIGVIACGVLLSVIAVFLSSFDTAIFLTFASFFFGTIVQIFLPIFYSFYFCERRRRK